MLGWLIVKQRNKIIEELNRFNLRNNLENLFYSTMFAFIGFNIVNSLTSKYFETATILDTPISVPVVYIYSVTFSPIIEEYICRGFIFKRLNHKLGFKVSALISSILFAIPHFNPAAFLGYVFIGFLWCWYYNKSNSLIVPIISHAAFNFISILIMSLKG